MRRLPTSWQTVFRKLGFTQSRYRVSNRPSPRRWHRQLHLEPLEDRQLLSITVNTLVDENDGIAVGGISLRDAIAAAAPGETIDFSVTGTIPLTNGELLIDKDLTISGPGANLLTIDASGNDSTPTQNNGDGSRVIRITDGNNYSRSLVSISGVTITGGDVNHSRGGGVWTFETLALTNCVISDNHVASGTNSGSGGGIFVDSHSYGLTVTDCTISGNTARWGGGIHYNGGFIYPSSTLANSNRKGLIITRSTIDGNEATLGSGGGVYINRGAATIAATTISNNIAAQEGGGIWNREGHETSPFSVENSTISNNRAGTEGGGFMDDAVNSHQGSVSFRNVTITENKSPNGGGIRLRSSGTMRLVNSIVSGNTNLDGTAANNISGTLLIHSVFNLLGTNGDGGASPQTNILNVDDPLLGPLQDNGGPTETHLPNYLPMDGVSPAVDAGFPNSVYSLSEFDQRGNSHARVLGGRIDIGAVETPGEVVLPQPTASAPLPGKVDFVLMIDASGSASTSRNLALRDLVKELDATLSARGVSARYGLVAFADSESASFAHSTLVGTGLLGTAAEFADAVLRTLHDGGSRPEDGWDAIEHALAEYDFRDGAAVQLVLHQQGDDRIPRNLNLTKSGILSALNSKNAVLNSIIEASFDPALGGDFALGIDSDANDGEI